MVFFFFFNVCFILGGLRKINWKRKQVLRNWGHYRERGVLLVPLTCRSGGPLPHPSLKLSVCLREGRENSHFYRGTVISKAHMCREITACGSQRDVFLQLPGLCFHGLLEGGPAAVTRVLVNPGGFWLLRVPRLESTGLPSGGSNGPCCR